MKPRGRALWPMVLVLACAMVATDFVRHPFRGAAPGDASGPARDVALWIAGTDARATPARLARAAGRQLGARVHVAEGGSSAAIVGLLDRDVGAQDPLLLVHAGTLADLASERRQRDLPGVPEQAARAQRLLRQATPIALIADDALLLASARRGGPADAGQLLASLRAAPGRLVFGVGGDPWSKAALAAFVGAADATGRVPYRALPSPGDAGVALTDADVDVVLAPASELRRPGLAARLLPLAQSGAAASTAAAVPSLGEVLGRRTTVTRLHRWVMLVAPPTVRGTRRAQLTTHVRTLVAGAAWRRTLRRNGLGPPPAGDPAAVLGRAGADADALFTAAARVDRLATTARR